MHRKLAIITVLAVLGVIGAGRLSPVSQTIQAASAPTGPRTFTLSSRTTESSTPVRALRNGARLPGNALVRTVTRTVRTWNSAEERPKRPCAEGGGWSPCSRPQPAVRGYPESAHHCRV